MPPPIGTGPPLEQVVSERASVLIRFTYGPVVGHQNLQAPCLGRGRLRDSLALCGRTGSIR